MTYQPALPSCGAGPIGATILPIERVLAPRRAVDPDSLFADPSRIKATLPWRPRHEDLDEIVAHALAWERKLAEMRATA